MTEFTKKLYNLVDGKSFNDVFDGSLKTWARYTVTCASCEEKREIMSTNKNVIDDVNFCNKCLGRDEND